jgi:hypothetical protein
MPMRNKNCLWWPCLLMNRDEMSNLYRGPSKDAPYQVSIHLAKRFQRRRFFRNQPIRNKNGLWWPCLLMNLDEMSNLYRGPAIDASYQISVHLARKVLYKDCSFRPDSLTNMATTDNSCFSLADLGSITFKCNQLHYNYFAIFMITLHYDYINFQM